jgi:hypothetical protein
MVKCIYIYIYNTKVRYFIIYSLYNARKTKNKRPNAKQRDKEIFKLTSKAKEHISY